MSLFRKRKRPVQTYDSSRLVPAIRSSICTGERVAGFKDRESGSFTEIMLLQKDSDLEEFKARYGIEGKVEVFY